MPPSPIKREILTSNGELNQSQLASKHTSYAPKLSNGQNQASSVPMQNSNTSVDSYSDADATRKRDRRASSGGAGTSADRDMSPTMEDDIDIKEQDRFLPIANVARIMKKALPDNAKIAKEAKECVQECVSEFISFITSEASEKCQMEKRKTINGEDILYAMASLGFDNYAEALKIYLAKYRETTKLERASSINKDSKEDGEDGTGATGHGEDDIDDDDDEIHHHHHYHQHQQQQQQLLHPTHGGGPSQFSFPIQPPYPQNSQ